MRAAPIRCGFFAALVIALGAMAVEAAAQGACQRIVVACEEAGFVRGAAGAGSGLVRDCIEPITQGTAQRRLAALSAAQKASLHATLEAVKSCHDAKSCQAGEQSGADAAPR